MPMLPFPEWTPDQPDFQNPGSATIKNVVPLTKQSYGPMPGPVSYSGPLTARCQGAYSLADAAGNPFIFAGDANRLYLLKSGSPNFVDISKTSAPAPYSTPALAENGFWSATSFGNRVVMTNGIDPVQSFLVPTDTNFSDLAAAAPRAYACAAIRDFLMLGNTIDNTDGAQPQRLHWCAIGNPTSWPVPGTDAAISVQSDFQDLQETDLGQVKALIGGSLSSADGAAFCERGIYRIGYVGSPAIFDFTVAEGASGTQAPLSIVPRRLSTQAGTRGVAFYLGEEGWYAFDGIASAPIGAGKIDKAFFKDLDASALALVQGSADPVNKLVYWLYTGTPQTDVLYNRLLVYNWELQRWALCDLSPIPAEWILRSLTLGYTLDQLDPLGNVEQLAFSLDSRVWTGGKPILSLFNNGHQLCHMTGPNLAPTLETSETQPFPGRRARILNGRPIIDGVGASLSIGTREILANTVTYQAAIPTNVIGECPQRVTGRYVRAQVTLPAASLWTHLQGVEIEARPEGRR